MRNRTGAILIVGALSVFPNCLSAQLMPGGRTVDVGRLRGDFYSQMVAKVNEVMDSWQAVWRKVGEDSLPDLYTLEASLLQPGGVTLKGRGEIEEFSRSSFPLTSALRTGMQDLEACEGFAYLSGYYAIDPARAERGSSTGRHFTVIQKEGGDWLIRHQLFLPDSGAVPFPGVVSRNLLEPLTNDDIRRGSRGASRFAAFGDAEYVLMAFRDAWQRKDARDAASFFGADAWVRFPHEAGTASAGGSIEDRLRRGMAEFRDILTVDLDFDRRDRLSFLFGRYHAEGMDGKEDRAGHFLMLLKNAGNGWLIRSLVFS